MKIVVFGLAISSSWGNGHATLWRALVKALARRGHAVVFFERDVPYYATTRDYSEIPGGRLVLYSDWPSVRTSAARHLAEADVAMVTSFCPDGLAATEAVMQAQEAVRVFYDLDTPVTLVRFAAGERVGWIGPRGLRDFDLVFSFTGGPSIEALSRRLGARRVVPLYGSVDPEVYRPAAPSPTFAASLSYIGTYASDRQATLDALFLEPARRLSGHRFVLAGAQYPADFPWQPNIFFVRHLTSAEHPPFFAASRLTLNVTRGAMAAVGYCPSGRLFEAAACGTPVLSDGWEGLDLFYEPGREILIAQTPEDAIAAIGLGDVELRRIGRAARGRTLDEHTADHRVAEFERALSLRESDLPTAAAGGA